ncbi:MAG: hypothetical protein EPO07_04720, partial [Verrucomicrobia bacterium]
MKKIAASVGLVTLGAVALQNANAAGLADAAGGKPWSVSATLRGFYDDNIFTSSSTNRVDSFGMEVSPSVGYTLVQDQTSLGAKYTYSGSWYEAAQSTTLGHWSHSHEFQGDLAHAFSPRVNVLAREAFVIGQEPDSLRSGNYVINPQRIPGSNVRNNGKIVADIQVTREFSLEVGYGNNYWDYENKLNPATDLVTFTDSSGSWTAVNQSSLSGELDRIEHLPSIEGNWLLAPQTHAVLGYQFTQVNFTGDEPISGTISSTSTNHPVDATYSADRDSRQHTGYGGLDHTFGPDLSGSIRAGVTYRESYNSPSQPTDLAPYVSAGLNYAPTPDTSVSLNYSHDLNVSDVVGTNPANFVRGMENDVISASLTHTLSP